MYAPFLPPEPRSRTAPPGWVGALAPILIPTLVVGGEASFVMRKLSPRLTRHGLHVAHHWPWKKQNGSFPENISVVFILTDMCGHSMSGAALEEGRKRGIPVIMGTRKHAVNIQKLTEAGFPEIPLLAPKPIESKKTRTPVPEPIPSPEPVPTPEEAPTMPNPLSATNARPPVILRKAQKPLITNETTLAIMRLLAMSPGVSNRKIVDTLPNITKGGLLNTVQEARSTLGITTGRGKQIYVDVDEKVFTEACDRYNFDRVAIPPGGRYPKENLRLGRPPGAPDKETAKAESLRMFPAPAEVATVPPAVAPEVLASPVAPPAPVPVTAPVTAPVSFAKSADPMQDMKDAVALLRAVMAAHGVETITVTPTTTNMRRVVVVEESLD